MLDLPQSCRLLYFCFPKLYNSALWKNKMNMKKTCFVFFRMAEELTRVGLWYLINVIWWNIATLTELQALLWLYCFSKTNLNGKKVFSYFRTRSSVYIVYIIWCVLTHNPVHLKNNLISKILLSWNQWCFYLNRAKSW